MISQWHFQKPKLNSVRICMIRFQNHQNMIYLLRLVRYMYNNSFSASECNGWMHKLKLHRAIPNFWLLRYIHIYYIGWRTIVLFYIPLIHLNFSLQWTTMKWICDQKQNLINIQQQQQQPPRPDWATLYSPNIEFTK